MKNFIWTLILSIACNTYAFAENPITFALANPPMSFDQCVTYSQGDPPTLGQCLGMLDYRTKQLMKKQNIFNEKYAPQCLGSKLTTMKTIFCNQCYMFYESIYQQGATIERMSHALSEQMQ